MISEIINGVIELGNINIKCIIFKINSDNSYQILSTSLVSSEGVHNGAIINLNKAANAVRLCISKAEKESGISLKKINVILEQTEFICTTFSKYRKIDGAKIQQEDIEFLLKESKKQVTNNDIKQTIIHIFNHNYIVDGKTFIEEPINVYADYLSHEMTFITMPKNNIKNINQVFIDCDIDVERIISSTFALGVNSLSNDEFNLGSSLLDIGSEKTSLGLFKNYALVHSITLPIGVNHLTKDISKVCSLSLNEAETIRNKIDFSFKNQDDLFDQKNILRNSYFTESSFRKISKTLITNIVTARLDEIFGIMKKQLNLTKINKNLGINILIVGGGSKIKNLEKYCSNFFGSEVKKLEKNKNYNKATLKEDFSSCLGAIQIIKDGWETEAIPQTVGKFSKKMSFFAKIFGNT